MSSASDIAEPKGAGLTASDLDRHRRRLQRLAAAMCVFVAVTGALAELAVAWVWLSPGLVVDLVAPRIGLAPSAIATDGATRLAGFAVSSVPLMVVFYLLHQAYEVFDAYRRGLVFTADAVRRIRRIGLSALALAVLRPATQTLLGLVLTAANPPGQRMLVIGVSVEDLMLAAFGGLIVAIGHVMGLANALAEDASQIV